MKSVIIFCLSAIALAFAQKQSVAVLPSVGELESQKLDLLTDKVREIASAALPPNNFTLLKQDAVIKRIGEEDFFKACKEGTCIGDLAKKANADYGARCDVLKIDKNLVLKFELYSVKDEAILETFADYDAEDFYGMIAVLDKKLPGAFKKMLGVSGNSETASPSVADDISGLEKVANYELVLTGGRDDKRYKVAKIGSQTWMAENLNYNASGSVCYDNKSANCQKYGRLYDWNTAKNACPKDWHLPTQAEWDVLNAAVEAVPHDLRSNLYGFVNLQGGFGYFDGRFASGGAFGFWWSVNGYYSSNGVSIGVGNELAYWGYDYKKSLFSVRCVKN